ncbi:MAG: putative O-glycosylation ligase, exosortase A system-associated, partial [Alphaproteobacteria bacterium]|nr:putative O-glycosylation ligase, exosortase A system-associated [Alphaproteobacteria bacterium]
LLGFRKPFLFVLGYVYVDIVSPQRLSYYLINSVPVSLIFVVAAVLGWFLREDKSSARFTFRQFLMVILLIDGLVMTLNAQVPDFAWAKWDWVWKALAFAIFLPFTLRTKLRIEALITYMVIAVGSIIVVGGIKTLATGGGGYGELNLMVSNNTGLYESSIISAVAASVIPLALYLRTHSTIFRPGWMVNLYTAGIVFACALIPVGTAARTGLICVAVLAILMLRSTKRRFLYLAGIGLLAAIVIPLLPASFTSRMNTIEGYKQDTSAFTRIEVWKWTLDYVNDHPWGGGFDAYRINHIRYYINQPVLTDGHMESQRTLIIDKGRAYHSSYFEMLGEAGWFGLFVWLLLHISGLIRMEILFRRFRKSRADETKWIAALATALQQAHIVYLVGCTFVGIAYQPFIYMLVGLQIGLDSYASRLAPEREPNVSSEFATA